MEGKLKKIGNEYKLYAQDDSCIATTHESPYKKLSLKNCQAIENGYDLDELVKEQYPIDEPSFKRGFKLALEILGDKKFSEEDVTFMFQFGFNLDNPMSRNEYDAHIQSLQQTEWDVEIEMWFHGTRHKKGEWIPKLDADGCLILKRK